MTDVEEHDMDAAAIVWLTRVTDPAFEDWTDWSAWMEADPRHATAYWRLAATDAEFVETARRASVSRPIERPKASRRRLFRYGVGMAACLAAGAGVWSLRPSSELRVTTRPGETRAIALAGNLGTAYLNGGGVLIMNRAKPGDVSLEAGQVLFDVAGEGLSVQVGDARIEDIGTVFDVRRTASGVRVEVREGRVRYARGDQSAEIGAGERLEAVDGRLVRSAVAPDDVAGWRDGRLAWQETPIAEAAQDLSRSLGVAVRVDPRLMGRTVSGSLRVGGDGEAARTRIAAFLDLTIEVDDGGWTLRPRAAGAP